jgi:ankyrin repeat protein
VVELLLEAGANTAADDDDGRTGFDHAAAGGITDLEDLLRKAGKPGQPLAYKPASDRSVALHGLSLGMNREEVSSRLPGLNLPPPDRCGLSYVAIPARRLTTLSEFDGVILLRLAFLNGRLVYLHAAYEPRGALESFDRYLTTLSARLRLPNRWRRTSGGFSFDNAHSLAWDGFIVVAGHLKASYVELHDMQAVRTLVRRWEESSADRP